MGYFKKNELDKYKTEIQFQPPYRSHYWSQVYRILMLFTSIFIPIVGGSLNYKNSQKITQRQILKAETWIWMVTAITNLIGIIYYCIMHPKGSYKKNDDNEEDIEGIADVEEDKIPQSRKIRFKKNYDKDFAETLIERLQCLTSFYEILFGINYSVVFSNTQMFWIFQRDDFSLQSIFVHSVLVWFVYVPFIWEWIQMSSCFVWFSMLFGIIYFLSNLIYVKLYHTTIYNGLNWEAGYSYAWTFISVLQIFIGYIIGEWFSKIQRRYWLPKFGRIRKIPENCDEETQQNLDSLRITFKGSMISNNADTTDQNAQFTPKFKETQSKP